MFSMDVRYYLAPVPTLAGIFILGELSGLPVTVIHDITRQFDPKLAQLRRPHITLAGSSGVGPIPADTPVATLRKHLEPVAASTAPIALALQPAHRFPQTNTIVLPIDPHGPIRVLHDRIASSGLSFGAARFTFSPHVTLNLYRTLTRDTLDALLRVRITEPVMLNRLQLYLTSEPRPAKLLLDLPLAGGQAG
jgi:2'-5' RNA ligase